MKSVVDSFNARVEAMLWLDFDVVTCSPALVVLHSGLDLTMKPEFELSFHNVFFSSLLMTWKTDKNRPILEILSDSQEFFVNNSYKIDQGFTLFGFIPQDTENDVKCIIAAERFSWQEL